MIKRLIAWALVVLATMPALAATDNTLAVADLTSSAGSKNVTLTVSLLNTDSISDLQFDLYLPGGISISKDEDDFPLINVNTGRTTARRHRIDYREHDTYTRVLCTSSMGYKFSGNNGAVVDIEVDIDSTLAAGDYKVVLKNVVVSNANATYLTTDSITGTISIVGDKPQNTLAIEALTSGAGAKNVRLTIDLQNTDSISDMQFDLYLPGGISISHDEEDFPLISVNTGRTTARRHRIDYREHDTYTRVLCTSSTGYKFSGNDGAVVDIELDIDSSLATGDYTVTLKNVVVSNANATYLTPGSITGIITITENKPQYAEGYSVWISPFAIAANSDDNEIPVLMNNKTDGEITVVDFDLYLPDGITLYQEDGEYVADPGSRFNSNSIKNRFTTEITTNTDGSLHLSSYFTRTTSSYVISGTSGDFLSLTLLGDATLKDSICRLDIKNVVLNDEIKVAPYSASVFVGQPVIEQADIYGTFDDDAISALNNAIAKSTTLSYLDLTAADLGENHEITPANENALLFVGSTAAISNTKNVVQSGVCDNLVITDRMNFSTPKDFTANNASYQRPQTYSWGTICLPFAVSSDNETQFYKLTSVGSDVMIFSEIDDVEAYTPAAYHTTGTSLDISQSNVSVSATPEEELATQTEVNSWTMIGSLANQTLTLGDDQKLNSKYVYGISNNQYVRVLKKATIPAFRAWFEYAGNAAASSRFGISVVDNDPLAINDATATVSKQLSVYCNRGSVSLNCAESTTVRIYSINGTLVSSVDLSAGETRTVSLPSGVYTILKHKIIIK